MAKIIAAWVLAFPLGLLFYRSSLPKFRSPLTFRSVLSQYRIVPVGLLDTSTVALPVLEFMVAIWLLLPATRPFGAVAGAVLQLVFAGAVGMRLGEHFPRGCGCFQLTLPQTATPRSLGANLLLAILLVGLAILTWPA